MNTYGLLAGLLIMAALGSWATLETGRADEWKGKYDSLTAKYSTAAASAITHAQAVTAKGTQQLQTQGTTALASAATKTQAAKGYYKTVYLPSLTKLDPKDEASKCASMPVPASILSSLSNGPGG